MYIRQYRPSDCKELMTLFYDTVHTVNAKDYTGEQLDAWADGKADPERWDRSLREHYSLVAVEDGILVGFGDIDGTGYLDRLYVHRDYQKRGIATGLCDELEKTIQGKIVTHASVTARPFFEKRGYLVLKEQQVERRGILLTNYVMEKNRAKNTYRYKNDIFVSWEEKSFPFHIAEFSAHNVFEIYVLLEGERSVYIGEKRFDTCAGTALMIAPDVPHRSEGATPYRGVCIQFTEKQLDEHYTPRTKKRLLSCFGREVIRLDKNELSELQLFLYRMLEEPEDKAFYLPAVLALFRTALRRGGNAGGESRELGGAAGEGRGQGGGRLAVDIGEIESYLRENAAEITGLEQVAEHFFITKGYLCTLFKRQTGMTVTAYLNNIRIQEACRLLTVTEDSVEQICTRCGFRSSVYFHRLFKRMMNYTPAGYRTLIRRSHRKGDSTSELVP